MSNTPNLSTHIRLVKLANLIINQDNPVNGEVISYIEESVDQAENLIKESNELQDPEFIQTTLDLGLE